MVKYEDKKYIIDPFIFCLWSDILETTEAKSVFSGLVSEIHTRWCEPLEIVLHMERQNSTLESLPNFQKNVLMKSGLLQYICL